MDITTAIAHRQPSSFELRFQSLFHSGRALIFPCDEHGSVFMDTLSEKARENYLFATRRRRPRVRESGRARLQVGSSPIGEPFPDHFAQLS